MNDKNDSNDIEADTRTYKHIAYVLAEAIAGEIDIDFSQFNGDPTKAIEWAFNYASE